MPVNLYYTQKVRGFQQENVKYSKNCVENPVETHETSVSLLRFNGGYH